MDKLNFLHNYPKMEEELGLDEHHVIVDKEDWSVIQRAITSNMTLIGDLIGLDCFLKEEKITLNKNNG